MQLLVADLRSSTNDSREDREGRKRDEIRGVRRLMEGEGRREADCCAASLKASVRISGESEGNRRCSGC